MAKKEKNAQQKEGNAADKRNLDSFFVLQKRKGLVFTHREIVGVDIGKSHIKVVQIDIKKSPPVIRGIHVEEIPIEKRDRGEVTEVYIIKQLKSLVKKANLKSSLAVSFVSGPSIYVHSCTVPEMPENQIEDALKADVAKDLPFSVDEAIVGYNVVGKTTGRKGQELEIAAVFAHKDVISRKIWLVEQSGLQPAGVTVLPFAYENVLSTKFEEAPENAVIITIGDETTGIDFFRNGSFMFTREVSASGKDINKALSGTVNLPEQKVDISIEEAEVIKREYGVVLDQTAHKDNAVLNQLIAKSRAVYEKMTTEIKRSLGYFARMAKITNIDAIYLCGGGANTKNILQFFKSQLEVDIEPFPFETYFSFSPAVSQKLANNDWIYPFILPACGIALEEINAKINLVPKITRLVSKIASFKSVYNFALFVLSVFAIIFFSKIKKDTGYYQNILNDLNSNFENVSEKNEQVLIFQAYKAKVNRKKKVLQTLIGQKPIWYGVLKEISHITPVNVYLKEVKFDYDNETKNIQMTMSGQVLRSDKSVDYTVSQFSLDMKKSHFFTDVNLENTKTTYKKGKQETVFSLKSNLLY